MTTYQRATGAAIDRIEGRAKVHGEAKYAYEYEARDVAYAVLVTSTIARGKVVSVEGATLWHGNAPRLHSEGELALLQSDEVVYRGQGAAAVGAASRGWSPWWPPTRWSRRARPPAPCRCSTRRSRMTSSCASTTRACTSPTAS